MTDSDLVARLDRIERLLLDGERLTLTAEEAARELHTERQTVYRLVHGGRPRAELEAFVRAEAS